MTGDSGAHRPCQSDSNCKLLELLPMAAMLLRERRLKVGMAQFMSHHTGNLFAVIQPRADDDFVNAVLACAGVMAFAYCLATCSARWEADTDSHCRAILETKFRELWVQSVGDTVKPEFTGCIGRPGRRRNPVTYRRLVVRVCWRYLLIWNRHI